MCGIIGIVGHSDPVAPLLLEGLARLEYRGYDSAGIATVADGRIDRRRAEGKLANLKERVQADQPAGSVGIGHTRWATHGAPTENNAHPHATERVAVVHNGIIENYADLKAELVAAGRRPATDTDTEIVALLLTEYLDEGLSPAQAVGKAMQRMEGAFALALLFSGQPRLMIGARRGSPLAVGWGDGETYLGSDALALAPLTSQLTYLEEGDWVVIDDRSAQLYDHANQPVERPVKTSQIDGAMIGKGNYRHFMLKEIFEQPVVVGDTLHSYVNPDTRAIAMPLDDLDFSRISRLSMSACGTAYYAALVARYWFEPLAGLPVDLDIASELRYRDVPYDPNGLSLFISQSGETADTMAALRQAKAEGQTVAGIVNVPESSIARAADYCLRTVAGPEIGVASTKAFTTQLTVLACLAIKAGRQRGRLSAHRAGELVDALVGLPAKMRQVLQQDEAIQRMAGTISGAQHALYLGRASAYPLALEGALKLKEISYIHAEGYAAGEMKHGPIALIDETMPVIVSAPSSALFDKTASNVEEVMARQGRVYLFADKTGIDRLGARTTGAFTLPDCDPLVAPILYALPVQLLAYHTATQKGTDVDQPRNLAKSVTVE